MEIKPQELRIGNFILELKFLPSDFKLKEVTADTFGKVRRHPKYFKPIELTPEWLERFGFHGIDDDGLWGIKDNNGEYLFQLEANYLESENSFSHIWDSSYTGAPVKYVHQIQNLYFSLTGEELAIDKTSLKK